MLPNRKEWILNHEQLSIHTIRRLGRANLFRLFLPLTVILPFVLLSGVAKSLDSNNSSVLKSRGSAGETPAVKSPPLSATPQPAVNQSCVPTSYPVEFTHFANQLVQVANWTGEPTKFIETLSQKLGPQLAAYFSPSPFPDINQRARLARVPVIMYHDILPKKQVFFDVTPQEFEQHLQLIQKQGLTPISFDQLTIHLRTGLPLPEKPIMLTFDDGYGGHYEYVYPLLKKYGYPGVFSIYTSKVGVNSGRTHVSWEQLREMVADPLFTIAAHSLTHPPDLRVLSDDKLKAEIFESKQIIENKLGIPIRYFTYPAGKYDERVAQLIKQAGYQAALTMDDNNEGFAGESKDLLAIDRFGQSNIARSLKNLDQSIIAQAWGGTKLPNWGGGIDFDSQVAVNKTTIDNTYLVLVSGGKPITIHAKSRYQVGEILAGTQAVAGVDGGFFSLKFLNSNIMIGPVLSQINNTFVPGNRSENPRLNNRPLVLISPQTVKFIPFDAEKHNTLEGIQAEMPNVTDAFVASAWLVKDSVPQPAESFGNLYGFDAKRRRAFWGINQLGQPTIGVAPYNVDSVTLGAVLAKAGLRDAIMLDSGDSASLVYKGESQVPYTPRPVPHVVALVPPGTNANCLTVQR